MMGFGLLLMLLFWGILIAGAVWLVRAILTGGSNTGVSAKRNRVSAREVLDQRYAKGEITREQYQLMSEDVQA
ncbi:MAG: SHOCT domain-containing protein [Anaerolineales bacterium]|nr:SHOCT domain-containing protein [Anaerolineales bacterium]